MKGRFVKTHYYLTAIIFIVFSNTILSQSDLRAFNIQQSPVLAGAGQIGVSIPTKDVLGFYFNPAILGYTSKENHASFYIMPEEVDWANSPQLTFSNYGFNVGYNFENNYPGLPLSIGFGFVSNRMKNGRGLGTIDKDGNEIIYYTGKDAFSGFSLGIGFDYIVSVNLGLSVKQYNSEMASGRNPDNTLIINNASGTSYDYGAMVLVPVSKLLFPDAKYSLNENTFIKPKADFVLGCSLMNWGKDISYENIPFGYPLPRYSNLGYTLMLGLDMNIKGVELEAIKYSYTVETTNALLRAKTEDDHFLYYYYQKPFSDVDLWQNFFKLRSTSIYLNYHIGQILNLFETVGLEFRGYFDGFSSYGFNLSTEGPIKLLSREIDTPVLDFIANHIALNYSSSYAFTNFEESKTNIKGLSISFRNFGF